MTRTLSTIFALSFALLLTAAATQAQAQRTFVSTTGNDANTASLCSALNPCRSFGAALGVTNTNGEIIALTSGGYGAVTINKGVQITAPTGVYAAITASSGDAITVAAAGAVVVLRGLTLNSQGATDGINATAVFALHIEGCIVNGFITSGIKVSLTADGSQIFIKDTIVRNGGNTGSPLGGIYIDTSSGTVTASIDHCRLENNRNGVAVGINSRVIVRDSIAAGNANRGFQTNLGTTTNTVLIIENCVSTGNYVGVEGAGASIVRVSNSTISNNSYGVSGNVISRINNTLEDNGGGNAFGTPYAAK